MFEGLYSNLSQKYPKRRNLLNTEVTLEDFLEEETPYDEKKVIQIFIKQLKSLLEEDETLLLIEKISLLDGTLKKLRENFKDHNIPDLSDFYQDLSPILMQKYWEMNLNPPSKEAFDSLFLHSTHIALEEEIYIWQGKIN